MNMKFNFSICIALLLLLPCCMLQSYEQLTSDLLGEDQAAVEKAVEQLAADPKAYPRCAAALVVRDKTIRKRYMAVFDRAGDRAIPAIADTIGTINISTDHFDMYVTFFKDRQDAGYQALLHRYDLHADTMKDAVLRKDFGITTMNHLRRMGDLGRVMMALPQSDVGSLTQWLTHPFEGAREQTAKILCAKAWAPAADIPGPEPQVYYSLLSALTGCIQAETALEKMVKLARRDFASYLETEVKFPSPHGVFYRVLSDAGTDDVVAYCEKKCSETNNEFLFVQYWRVLKHIKSPASEAAQKRLLTRKDLPDLLRTMVKKTDQTTGASSMAIQKK